MAHTTERAMRGMRPPWEKEEALRPRFDRASAKAKVVCAM